MALVEEILENINKCCLPKLSRNLEELENHPEFSAWEKNLTKHFPKLISLWSKYNLKESNSRESKESKSTVFASLLILHYELLSDRHWGSPKSRECLNKLNRQSELLYKISLKDLLNSNTVCNVQEVFDKSMELLHKKLTAEDFKKYPALIEVYFCITTNIKKYKVILKPTSLLPIALLLMDDYVNENKIKGLQCCTSILGSLTRKHFQDGNYYEVIYGVVKKLVTEKDLRLTDLVLECLLQLFKIIPADAKVSTIDNTLHIILDQIYTESNLYKKKLLFVFVNKIINMHGIHCAKRTMFLKVVCDNLDICSNDAVADILLADVLECLENWTRYCWCVWRLQPNKKLLSVLIKLLYIYNEDEKLSRRIQNLLITLFKLCSVKEIKLIFAHLETSLHRMKGFKKSFTSKIEAIKNSLKSTSG